MRSVRAWAKRTLPPKAVKYGWRLTRWAEVLREVRGDGPAEQAKLLASALAAPVTAALGLGEWRTPVLLLDTRVRAGPGRFHCRRLSDDLWHMLPSIDMPVREALKAHLGPGAVFIDAGANIGVLTILGARLVGAQGQVIAVEMMPDTAQRLRENLALNAMGWVQVVEKALSDVAGQQVRARMPVGLTGHASIVHDPKAPAGTVEVVAPTTTLDDLTGGLAQVDVLKVDLEGAEALAFKGGRDTLARTRCVIFEARGHGDDAADGIRSHGFSLSGLGEYDLIGVR